MEFTLDTIVYKDYEESLRHHLGILFAKYDLSGSATSLNARIIYPENGQEGNVRNEEVVVITPNGGEINQITSRKIFLNENPFNITRIVRRGLILSHYDTYEITTSGSRRANFGEEVRGVSLGINAKLKEMENGLYEIEFIDTENKLKINHLKVKI